ncbi:protein kinase family protein [Peribacillus simplex]|uniref:protein kinase family protein n=1 Tax=Peribacillus simplex TaxID=1478 RepID=UPI001921A1B0|nr:protein kinase family protein [Peribacillus simplex]MBD8591216.1 protein kinase family protein [Peribacillus simplex]
MLTIQKYEKILSYFDQEFWDGKTTETNWNYYGLILDWYFESSVLSIDYLDIADYFQDNGGFKFTDDINLIDQYKNVDENKRLKILGNILNILKHSKVNEEKCKLIIQKVSNVLKKNNIKIENPEYGYLIVVPNDILDSGSYCNVVRVKEGILRKELKLQYQNDEKLNKRMQYEFENMRKLSGCPQILNVYEFNPENNTYLMEQGEKNLYDFLKDQIELSFEVKLKIIMDLLKGMEYAHEKSIIHRDLHLGNVLKINNEFVVCDFGLSKDLSIERSMKSSFTEKNNHLFVDPLAISDFTKLDQKSDIFSIGKIIDFVLLHNETNPNHQLKSIVERCTCRDKALRYSSCTEIITEIELILKNQGQEETRQSTINKILNNQYDSQVHELVIDLANNDTLSKFIVTHQLSHFGKLILKFESFYQEKILDSMMVNYAEATGYNGWKNYDIFASIAYYLCLNVQDLKTKKIAEHILTECANIRYSAKNLLDSLPI